MSEPRAPFVVGVDRPSSGAGVAYAATEALRTGRPLELVHVAPELNGWLTIVGRDVLRLAVMRADCHRHVPSRRPGRRAGGSSQERQGTRARAGPTAPPAP